MVLETLWPDSAPWWLNLFIWMALFWQYIMISFIPAFYIAIVKLFGMPLLQRWSKEVVIMLYPTKVKFARIDEEHDPYFLYKKGIYWKSETLQPVGIEGLPEKYQAKLEEKKLRYEELMAKDVKTKKEVREIKRLLKEQKRIEKKKLTVNPINPIHIFTHAINQPIYNPERRETKGQEILFNNCRPKHIKGHGIWIMQNPKLHFWRHYQLVVLKGNSGYKLIPVKERQPHSIGFWHSLGVLMETEVEVETPAEIEVASGGSGKRLVQQLITTEVILTRLKEVQDYQFFSASRAYALLKRRMKLEPNFIYWITGSINPLVIIILIGMVAAIAAMFLFLHGSSPPQTGTAPPNGVHQIL